MFLSASFLLHILMNALEKCARSAPEGSPRTGTISVLNYTLTRSSTPALSYLLTNAQKIRISSRARLGEAHGKSKHVCLLRSDLLVAEAITS